MKLIPANSITFEVVYVQAQRCECGGSYRFESQHLLMADDLPIDRLTAVCEACGTEQNFFFDIHAFYGEEDQESHFERTEVTMRRAIEAIHVQRWTKAEAALRRVIDPEEGEPAFGWAHYHLGMVLLVQERPQEGLEEIRTAVALVPNEPEFYRGLSKALARLGREEEAAEALDRHQAFKARAKDKV